LLTGADGFIGSHLAQKLVEEGYSVKAFVYYNSFNSYGWLDSIPKEQLSKMEIFSGDIRDPNGVKNAVKGCDYVMHLAALIGIPFSYHSPDSYVDTNIKGTLNILNASRDLGIKKVLVTSTSEVYGTALHVPIDEEHPLQGQSPYSATKIGADQIALSFYRSFNLPVTVVRPFNTYGPRHTYDVIPKFINLALNNKPLTIYGTGEQSRDFTYVSDTIDGFLIMGIHPKAIGEVVNFGAGKGTSVKEIAENIKAISGSQSEIIYIEERSAEVKQLTSDYSKANNLFGWSPKVEINEGLRLNIEWTKKNL